MREPYFAYLPRMTAIQTAADYQQALARIESIFEATPGTPDFDELDALITLVEAYDAVHYPIPDT